MFNFDQTIACTVRLPLGVPKTSCEPQHSALPAIEPCDAMCCHLLEPESILGKVPVAKEEAGTT